MIEKFTFWLQTDKKAKLKIAFIFGVSVFLVVLTILIYNLYNQPKSSGKNSSNSSSSLQSNQEYTFGNSAELLALDTEALILPNRVFFSPDSSIYASFSQDLQLKFNSKLIPNSPKNLPSTVSFVPNQGVIVNPEGENSYFYSFSEKTTTNLSSDYRFLTYFDNSKKANSSNFKGFLGIKKIGNLLAIYQNSQLDNFNSAKLYANLFSRMVIGSFELRNFDQTPYIFIYEKNTKKGKMEIWKIDEKDPKLLFTINSLESMKTSFSKILFKDKEDLKIIDFTQTNPSILLVTDVLELVKVSKLLGLINPERCAISDKESVFLCLVKEESTNEKDNKQRDQIIEYNYNQKSLQLLYKNLYISGQSLYFDFENNLYIVGQKDRLLYKFKN